MLLLTGLLLCMGPGLSYTAAAEEEEMIAADTEDTASAEAEDTVPAEAEETVFDGTSEAGMTEEADDSESGSEEEELESEEEVLSDEGLPDGVKNMYIVDEMDFAAEAVDRSVADDSGMLLRGGAPSKHIPDLSALMPVRDQRPHGHCWAHAVAFLAERYMSMAGLAGSDVDLSEPALAYSLFYTPEDPLGGTGGDRTEVQGSTYLDIGANSFWGLEILSQWWGPVAESAVTLSPEGALVPAQPSRELLRSGAVHLKNFYMINMQSDADKVKNKIIECGAVAAAYWNPDGGVPRSTYFNSETNAFFYSSYTGGSQNHSIAIVGWDDSFPAGSFPTDPGRNGAWLVRNSWGGSGMGYDGYFWMSYAEPSLSKTAYAAEFESAGKYANNYQYDGGVSNEEVQNGTTVLQAANVFTAHAGAVAESVEAVSVGIASANTLVTVEVYTNLKDASNPCSGTKEAEGSGKTMHSGQYTILLDKAAAVNKGELFSVVVTLKNESSAGNSAKIMRERNYSVSGSAGSVRAFCAIQKGQSFLYSGEGWLDLVSGGGNLRIKAFTNNASKPVPRPTAAPTVTPVPSVTPVPETVPSVFYQTHVQTYGWQKEVSDGMTSGTTGESKRLEGIQIRVNSSRLGIRYRTHVQTYGWESRWAADGAMSGTSGQSKRLEAIQIELTGADADKYDVWYCVHAQQFGWLGWARNGESAGTAGYSYRLEGIRILITKKGTAAPVPPGGRWVAFYENGKEPQPAKNNTGALVTYNTHVQTYGWQDYVYDGAAAGTTGQSKRLEGIHIRLLNQKYGGNIEYCTHIQTYGWESRWAANGAMSGTNGQSKRLEAIRIRLTGEMAVHYDIWYQTHIQQFGWSGWAKNGEQCGSAGYSYRLEGIRICLVPKGGKAPGSTAGAFHSR